MEISYYIPLFFFKVLFIYLFIGGEGREKERERIISVGGIHLLVASHTPPTGDLAC